METNSGQSFWRKADTLRVVRMLLIGLAIGVTVRWMSISTPPVPVLANENDSPATNTPTPLKNAGASPSARD